jgi:histidyl-tRNA synthetase
VKSLRLDCRYNSNSNSEAFSLTRKNNSNIPIDTFNNYKNSKNFNFLKNSQNNFYTWTNKYFYSNKMDSTSNQPENIQNENTTQPPKEEKKIDINSTKDTKPRQPKEKKPKKGDKPDENADDSGKGTVKVVKGARDFMPYQMSIRSRAFKIITEIFKKHGAVEIDTPVFELKETLMGKYGEESKLIYDLQDQGGELLSLRYDLTVPFARYMAVHNFPSIKRYHIGKVYRRDTPQMSKGRFREFYQCDFDIAGPSYGKMIPDSEVLKVLVEILSELKLGKFIVKLNHRKILDATVALSGISEDKFKIVCSSVDKLDKEPWELVKKELLDKGITEEQCDKLWSFVQLKDSPWALLEKLKQNEALNNYQKSKEALEEMTTLFEYLDIMKITENFSFDLSLARGLDYYTGLIYEAVLTDSDKVGSIAGGGRYDELLGMFSSKSIPAVGVSIGIERVFNILEEHLKVWIFSQNFKKNLQQFSKNFLQFFLKLFSFFYHFFYNFFHFSPTFIQLFSFLYNFLYNFF